MLHLLVFFLSHCRTLFLPFLLRSRMFRPRYWLLYPVTFSVYRLRRCDGWYSRLACNDIHITVKHQRKACCWVCCHQIRLDQRQVANDANQTTHHCTECVPTACICVLCNCAHTKCRKQKRLLARTVVRRQVKKRRAKAHSTRRSKAKYCLAFGERANVHRYR